MMDGEETEASPSVFWSLFKAIATLVFGYAAALAGALVVVRIHIARTNGPDAQTSSGMYAFVDVLVLVAAFVALSIVPTLLALYFLRPLVRLWTYVSMAAVVVAITNVAAVWVLSFGSIGPTSAPPLPLIGLAAWARICVTPVLALWFASATVAAPIWPARWRFGVAFCTEVIGPLCAAAGLVRSIQSMSPWH